VADSVQGEVAVACALWLVDLVCFSVEVLKQAQSAHLRPPGSGRGFRAQMTVCREGHWSRLEMQAVSM
jgi:hypothetical protein